MEEKEFSDSDRARLQALATEQEHEEWLKRRRTKIMERITAFTGGKVGPSDHYEAARIFAAGRTREAA